jgi:methyl-accepting chemotaxis protein
MGTIKNFRIGIRLSAGFGVLLALLLVLGSVAMLQTSSMYAAIDRFATVSVARVEGLNRIQALANDLRRATLRSVIVPDADQKRRQHNWRDHDAALLEAAFSEVGRLPMSEAERSAYRSLHDQWQAYLSLDAALLALSETAGTAAPALVAQNELAGHAFTVAMKTIDGAIDLNHQHIEASTQDMSDAYRHTRLTVCAIIGVGLAMGAAIAWRMTRSITIPLRAAVDGAERVAAGDLTVCLSPDGNDEAAQLLRSLQAMTSALSEVVGGILLSGDTVATGSQQIAAGSLDLSQRTEQQAVAIEETAATMEALTRTVRQNADNAQQGSDLAAIATSVASRGGDAFGRMTRTMEEIEASSTQVAQIVQTVEVIASQINILAINAAVEAARAGEHGRGFAVVAGEVRELAQRSASASREIRRLISRSMMSVTSGIEHVDHAGRTMHEIIDVFGRVACLMREISAASRDQQSGIEQVNQAIRQMDAVTQQNAALVEQASGTAQSIAQQAIDMRALVQHFRVHAERPT